MSRIDNPKFLTHIYLMELASTNMDSKTYEEITAFLLERLDNCSKESNKAAEARAKAALIDRLSFTPGVDKISIKDDSGFQIGALDLRANGIGPEVTILIVGEE